MPKSRKILCLLMLIAVVLPSSPGVAEVVLLRNGGVLEGQVLESRSLYVVHFGNGNEVRLDRQSVEMVCDSMAEAYRLKSERNTLNDADQHIELAQWCARHEMFDEATAELNAVKRSRQNDVRIKVLRRKMELSRRAMETSAMATSQSAQNTSARTGTHASAVTQPDLKLVNTLSQSVVADFRSKALPRLLNGCATAGCHNVHGDNQFKLACDAPSRPVNRQMMIRNLNAVHELIDQDNPEQSRLLEYTKLAHGPMRSPAFRVGSKNYELIRQWVYRVVSSQGAGMQAGRPSAVVQAGFEQERAWTAEVQEVERKSGAGRSTSTAADPFDPEVFNRRFGVDRKQVSAPEKAAAITPSDASERR